MHQELKRDLFPLYKNLMDDVSKISIDLHTFAVQWGENFSQNEGILFVGKSTNGWVSKSRSADEQFDDNNNDRIFARHDQMKWIDDLSGTNEIYNTNRSAFLRVIQKTSQSHYNKSNWYSYVAWTNLYKVSLTAGNPPTSLKKLQEKTSISILKKEIDILSPKVVVFLTSGWETNFIKELGISYNNKNTIQWGKNITWASEKAGVKYIVSHHPQGKKENLHINAILDLIKI